MRDRIGAQWAIVLARAGLQSWSVTILFMPLKPHCTIGRLTQATPEQYSDS
jgi:hypothetical protein